MPATVMSTASLIALSAQATFCAPCICSANSCIRRRSSSGSPNRPNGSSEDMEPSLRSTLRCAMALPEPSETTTAVVTGASSGIGTEIARELARRALNLTLVARREDRLKSLAEELGREHGVRADIVAADVASEDGRKSLFEQVESNGRDVDVLVNNAGFGSA